MVKLRAIDSSLLSYRFLVDVLVVVCQALCRMLLIKSRTLYLTVVYVLPFLVGIYSRAAIQNFIISM